MLDVNDNILIEDWLMKKMKQRTSYGAEYVWQLEQERFVLTEITSIFKSHIFHNNRYTIY